jgi:hypothetical protein
MTSRLVRRLASPRAALVVVAIAVALQAPSLTTGFVADDHLHQLVIRGDRTFAGLPKSRLDLFTFARGEESNRALMAEGMFPWTADPALRLAFFRPLSSLTHLLDHLLAPDSPVVAHAQNLVWFALSLLALARFYRRIVPAAGVAGLALLLYAVDDARGPTVGWIANRNALVALALSLPVLELHDRWRREGLRAGAWLGAILLGLALLAGESALAVCAYLFAYAMCLERGPLASRLASLVPYALAVVAWRVIYHSLGYGAAHSGVYLDPAGDPVQFLATLPVRLPLLLLGQYALPWSDGAEMYRYLAPWAPEVAALSAALVLCGIAFVAAPLLRRSAEARFLTLGALGAAVPVCATFPADRLLSFVGVGAFGALALLFAEPPGLATGSALPRFRSLRSPRSVAGLGRRAVVAMLVGIHLLLSPPLAALRSRSMESVERALRNADRSLPAGPEIAGRTLVLVNPPGDLLAGYIPLERAARRQPHAAVQRVLASGTSEVTIARLDASTLRVRPARGFLENVTEHMVRSPRRPLAAGAVVELPGFTATVKSLLPDGRPAEVEFRFAVPLEDPSLVWAAWDPAGIRYAAWTPPAIGARASLPASSFFRAVLPPPDR